MFKKISFTSLVLFISLSSFVFTMNNKDDPFSEKPKNNLETVYGKSFSLVNNDNSFVFKDKFNVLTFKIFMLITPQK